MSKTLLAAFAHPDDEVFSTGGTLSYYAAQGADVYLLCATRGESGKITDPNIDPKSNKGLLREQELKDACAIMGINPPIFLDFHDSGRHERTQFDNPQALMNVDDIDLEKAVLSHLVQIQPDILIGFDPHGIYGHIDHIKMHRAVSAAFWSAANYTKPPKRLFYTAMVIEQMKMMQALRTNSPLAELDPAIYSVSQSSLAAIVTINSHAQTKEAAIKAHRSQVGPTSSFAGMDEEKTKEFWEALMTTETFTLGGLRGGFPDMPVDDLFAGL